MIWLCKQALKAQNSTLTIHNEVTRLTFESNAGGWFDRLLQTEKASKVTTLRRSAAASEAGGLTGATLSQAETQPSTSPESKQKSSYPSLRQATAREEKQKEEKEEEKQPRGRRTASIPIMHVCAHPRHWERLETGPNHLSGPINVCCW